MDIRRIFEIKNEIEFNDLALEIFEYQSVLNPVYKQYLKNLNVNPKKIHKIEQIPFLPIEFFKTQKVVTEYYNEPENKFTIFKSSGTTGQIRSKHYIYNINVYEKSFIAGFQKFFGNISDYIILALLPSYLEAGDSSLVYMVKKLMQISGNPQNGFYLHNFKELAKKIKELQNSEKKIILFGVSYALLEMKNFNLFPNTELIIIETGGMKGRQKEITRKELHSEIKTIFGTEKVYSEYGMTELLSQAYSIGNEIFIPTDTIKIITRDINDPFSIIDSHQTGGLNIIDLANIYSCSFLETKDIGKLNKNGFEVLGRYDNSEIRGCNLLYMSM